MKIAQYRYNHASHNNITAAELANIDDNNESPLVGKNIVRLGIQGPSGLHFCLNGNDTSELIIGSSGTYELDVTGFTTITSVTFPAFNTIKNPNFIAPTGSITIDIIYWEGGQ